MTKMSQQKNGLKATIAGQHSHCGWMIFCLQKIHPLMQS